MRAPQAASSRFTSAPYVLVAPLALVLVVFCGIPLVLVVVVSFFDLDKFDIIPTFVLTNYSELLSSPLTYTLYAKTIKYALIVWAITLVIGFTVSYFLVFHVRSILWQMGLFLLCTVPFWTSNVIRMTLDVQKGTVQSRNRDRKSTRLNSSHGYISYAVFCLKKKNFN